MLYLISAPPRTGKTLRAIKIIFERLNEGRIVYTNIIGIKIDGVICVNSTIDNPFDWRDLPNDSVVIWDEAHEHPAFADRNLIQDKQKMLKVRDIGTSLLLHGHFGFDIYLITQKPNLLHADVLAAVSTHYVMRRKFGFDAATIWEFGEAITTWSKSAADSALVKTYWKYPKHLYKFYVSSEKHNVKKTFPLKYIAFACVPFIIFGFAFKNASNTGFFGLFGKKEQQASVNQSVNSDQLPPVASDKTEIDCNDLMNAHIEKCIAINQERANRVNQQVQQATSYYVDYNPNDPFNMPTQPQYTATAQPIFAGCIKYNGKYYGYSQQGTKLNVTEHDCKRIIDEGDRPFNYFAQGQQNGISTQNDNTSGGSLYSQQNTTQNLSPMTADQYARYLQYLDDQRQSQQANNYVQPNLQSKIISGANAL